MKKLLVFIFVIILSFFLNASVAYGVSLDTTTVYTINDDRAINGDILIYNNGKITQANVIFSNQIFGVLTTSPVLVYRNVDGKGQPVMRTGNAEVNVTTVNGIIKTGDYITTSDIAGKGQKATQSGYVLGIALSDFEEEGKITVQGKKVSTGKVTVAIRIEYADVTNTRSFSRLLDYFNTLIFQSVQNPERTSQLVKLLTAAIIAIASVLFSFLIFARSIIKSIEAIGRNPLAKTAIQISILINAALTIITILIGIGAAYILLRS